MSENTRGPENQEPGSGDSPLSDETRQWSRDGLPSVEGPEPAADETVISPPPAAGEATTILPPVPAPSAGDQTTVLPTPPAGDRTGPGASEHTSVLPAAGADPWLGRAEVGGPPVRGAVPPPDEAEDGEPEPGGTWWLPVVIAVVGLLLLLAIGVGIWLVASNSDDPEPTPSPSRPVPSTVSTTSAPTPSPVATSAGVANIPPVVGLTLNDATKALDAVGLNYRLEYRATNDAASGTVIGVDPKAGTQVPAGYEVLLLIASTPPPSPSPSPSEEEEESPSPLASAS